MLFEIKIKAIITEEQYNKVLEFLKITEYHTSTTKRINPDEIDKKIEWYEKQCNYDTLTQAIYNLRG
jgi:hypothetical protein